MIVMSDILDKPVEELSLAQTWELLLPDNFAQARDSYLGLKECEKCGRITAVFQQNYIEEVVKNICIDCDMKLYDLLDELPCGVPETGYDRDSMYYFYARLIIEAFFKL